MTLSCMKILPVLHGNINSLQFLWNIFYHCNELNNTLQPKLLYQKSRSLMMTWKSQVFCNFCKDVEIHTTHGSLAVLQTVAKLCKFSAARALPSQTAAYTNCDWKGRIESTVTDVMLSPAWLGNGKKYNTHDENISWYFQHRREDAYSTWANCCTFPSALNGILEVWRRWKIRFNSQTNWFH